MGIYNKRRSISRRELKSTFKKDRGTIPKTGGKKYHRGERSKITGEVFGQKYGSQISKNEYRRVIRDLRSSGRKAKTSTEKLRINRKIDYLRKIGGKNI